MKATNYTLRILLFLIAAILWSCNENNNNETGSSENTGEPPRIVFEKTEHDFGRIQQGEKVGWFFSFRNEGGSELIITNARASCGCTVPDYSREPVPPGGEGKIKVLYDSSGRSGKEIKTVTIESNADNKISKLTLKVEVEE